MADRGSNIEKALREADSMTGVPCYSHTIQRAILEVVDEVSLILDFIYGRVMCIRICILYIRICV